MSNVFLSVVIPSFDEMANLQKGVLDKVANFFSKKKYSYEVIIVDDGSKDGSVEFVEEFVKDHKHFELIKNTHMGKAGAVTTGILAANGQYILFTDMDQATPIEEIDKMLPQFDEGFDLVIGSRNTQRRGAPFTRVLISRAAIILRQVVLGLHDISDTQCGFKVFKSDVAKVIFERIKQIHHGFHKISGSSVTAGFDMEFLYLAKKMDYSIKEVPVSWRYVETRRVNPISDSIEGVLELIRIKLNDLNGVYGK